MTEAEMNTQAESQSTENSIFEAAAGLHSVETSAEITTPSVSEAAQMDVVSSAAADEQSSYSQAEVSAQETASITIGELKSSGSVNINQNIFQRISVETEKPNFIAISTQVIRRSQRLFVPPQGYDQLVRTERNPERRLFLLYGERNRGKYTAALNLGAALFSPDEPTIYSYRQIRQTSPSLLAIVQHKHFEGLAEGKRAVFLFEDFTEAGFDLQELNRHCDDLNERLLRLNAFVIMTAACEAETAERLRVDGLHIQVADLKQILHQHLAFYQSPESPSYLSNYHVEIAHDLTSKLLEHLCLPYQIDSFCERLAALPLEEIDRKQLEELVLALAKRIGKLGQAPTRPWFNSLHPNAQLYAMMATLFDSFDRVILDELYALAVQVLRESGVTTLRDAREFGMDDMLDEVHLQEKAGRLRFSHEAFEQEVTAQLRNHHHLLWTFVDAMLKLIEAFSESEYVQMRQAMGVALGRLGVYNYRKLDAVLHKLAKHPHGGVVAAIGFALDEMCRLSEEHFAFVGDVLQRWSKAAIGKPSDLPATAGDPDLMFAAADSIGKIYNRIALAATDPLSTPARREQAEKLLQKLHDMLTELSRHFDVFAERHFYAFMRNMLQTPDLLRKLADHGKDTLRLAERFKNLSDQELDTLRLPRSVRVLVEKGWQRQKEQWAENILNALANTYQRLGAQQPKLFVDQLLTPWLQASHNGSEADRNLRFLALATCQMLFEENSDERQTLTEEQHLPLLALISSLLRAVTEQPEAHDMLLSVCRVLLVWLKRPTWATRIHTQLLHVINRATAPERQTLRDALSETWLDSDSEAARQIGQAIVARSYVLDGVPIGLPSNRYGVIALDASRAGRAGESAAQLGQRLFERYDPRINLQIVSMGMAAILAQSGQIIPSSRHLSTSHAMPRLLLPALELLSPEQADFAVVVTWGAIVDWQDVLESAWHDKLIVLAAKDAARNWQPELTVAYMNSRDSRPTAELERLLSRRLAQVIATLSPEVWWHALTAYDIPKTPQDIAAICEWLEESVAKLDDVNYAHHPGDITRTVAGLVQWLAATDLETCVALLQSWLEATEHDLFVIMGIACSTMLLRTYAHKRDFTPDQGAPLLRLLPPLAQAAAARHDSNGIDAICYAVRRWAVLPAWVERLQNSSEQGDSELLRAIEYSLRDFAGQLLTLFKKDWREPLTAEGESETPSAINKLADYLQLRIALGSGKTLPPLPEGYRYVLIVLDAAVGSTENTRSVRNFYRKVASGLLKDIAEESRKPNSAFARISPVVYRMGQLMPVTLPGERPHESALLPEHLSAQPRLLAPILELHNLDQVAVMLIFSYNDIIDREDWYEQWQSRIVLYAHREAAWLKAFKHVKFNKAHEEVRKNLFEQLRQYVGS
ncbi:MAG: hypothetical protein RML95_12120 [Anaerolineae bacterium]|nr:hypothetical protein [Anaerolineae bacterium]